MRFGGAKMIHILQAIPMHTIATSIPSKLYFSRG